MNGAQQLRKVDICGDTMNSSTIQLFPYISAGGRLFTDFSQTIQSNTCIFFGQNTKVCARQNNSCQQLYMVAVVLGYQQGLGMGR